MISTTDFKRGARILVEGEPYQIEDYQVQTPSARGAATLVRCKLHAGDVLQQHRRIAAWSFRYLWCGDHSDNDHRRRHGRLEEYLRVALRLPER